jgi:hypothetical protein
MAYITETTTTLADLVTKVNAFLVAAGWTSDALNTGTGVWAMHKSTIFFQARWVAGTPNDLALFQSLAYDGSAPGSNPNDSGNGAPSGTIGIDRHVPITNAPVRYYGFADGSSFHITIQVNAGLTMAHFGAGIFEKIGTWTGGEYVYGHRASGTDPHLNQGSTFLLDGLLKHAAPGGNLFAATLHCEGLPGQGASSKWGVCIADDTPGVDRASVARVIIQGGFRGGPVPVVMGRFEPSLTRGLLHMYPILNFYRRTNATGDIYPLGHLPNVRGINLRNHVNADEILSGSDTWKVFATSVRSITAGADSTTKLQGLAVKKVP